MWPFGLVDRIRVTIIRVPIGPVLRDIGDAQARRLRPVLTLVRKRRVPAFISETVKRGKPDHSAFT
ncbi:MAG: hypothetical protein JWN27_2576 [Candidatus Eremiobacteraeota bacterium]|nr:hypothetical protein [Candidatus Eremiobacteraeota bacterium]